MYLRMRQSSPNLSLRRLDRALSRMITDPFAWDDTVANRVFVLWRTGTGEHYLEVVTLKHLLKCVADPSEVVGVSPARASRAKLRRSACGHTSN